MDKTKQAHPAWIQALKSGVSVVVALVAAGHSADAVPSLLSHQGRIAVGNVNHNGPGYFKFALVNSTGSETYWTNDATASGEPATAITIAVSNGHYALLLGETNPLPPAIFAANEDLRLRTWFSADNLAFTQLSPDRRLSPAPYAFVAATAIGIAPSYETGGGESLSLGSISGNELTFEGAFAQPFATAPDIRLDGAWTPGVTSESGFSATAAFSPVTIDPGGQTGASTSLALIGGHPAIAYRDADGGDLYFTRAGDAAGQHWPAPNIVRVDGALDDVGQYASLAEVAGRPAIAYYDLTHGDLRFIRADDQNGSSWPSSPLTIDGTGSNTGRDCTLALVSGVPAIAYISPNSGEVHYAWAADAGGASWPASNRVVIEGSLSDYRQHTSLAEIDGRPAIATHDQTDGELRFIHLVGSDAGEPADWASVPVDTGGGRGSNPSLSPIGGFPAIAYESGSSVYYCRATDAGGSAWGVPVIVAPNASEPSLATTAGRPAISYYDSADGDLKLAIASDLTGMAWFPPITIDGASGVVGTHSSLAQVAGLPAIAYHDVSNSALRYASLPSPTWTAIKGGAAEPILASGVKDAGITQGMLGPEIGTWQKSGDDLVHPSGRVGIGRLATANALEIEGNASKTTAGAWLANSDRRIKTDIHEIEGALEKILAIRLVDFEYSSDYRAAHPGIEAGRRYANVIAQEFAEIFPDWVRSSGESLPGSPADKILQVDTYPITIYTAAAVQELAAQNQRLRERIERLERLIESSGHLVESNSVD